MVERVIADDREWFRRYPGATARLRPAVFGEAPLQAAGVDWQWLAFVRPVGGGARCRESILVEEQYSPPPEMLDPIGGI